MNAEQILKELTENNTDYGISWHAALKAMEIYGKQQWNAAIDKAADIAIVVDNENMESILSLKHKDNE